MTLVESNWSLIVTAPNAEFKVAEKLTRLEIEFLLIRRRLESIFHGRRIPRLAVAFPRYLFVCVHDAWEKVLDVRGVVDFVRIGMMPAQVCGSVIDGLRSRLDKDGLLPVIEKSSFSFGQKLKIIGNGLYSGKDVIFQYALSDGQACVLQEWFGSLRPVQIDVVDLVDIQQYRINRNRLRRLRRKKRHVRRTELPVRLTA